MSFIKLLQKWTNLCIWIIIYLFILIIFIFFCFFRSQIYRNKHLAIFAPAFCPTPPITIIMQTGTKIKKIKKYFEKVIIIVIKVIISNLRDLKSQLSVKDKNSFEVDSTCFVLMSSKYKSLNFLWFIVLVHIFGSYFMISGSSCFFINIFSDFSCQLVTDYLYSQFEYPANP